MFFRNDGRSGGHLDPFTAFNESVELCFGYNGLKHPMHDLIKKFSYQATPKVSASGVEVVKNETEIH